MRVGQIILAKLKYKDGKGRLKKRPYLVVRVDGNEIDVLTVSSVEGKEHKLGFKSNYRLRNYNPPFIKDSFVKLDSIQKINLEEINYSIGGNGMVLNEYDVNEILRRLYNE